MLQQFLESSQDPAKLSLMVKGTLTVIVPAAGFALKLIGHEIDVAVLQQIVDGIANFVMVVGTAVSAGMALWGLVRKAWSPQV